MFFQSFTAVSFLIPFEDTQVRDLFAKIAKYRKIWTLQWDDYDEKKDDDQYTNAGDSKSPSPEPSPSAHVPAKAAASSLLEEMKAACADGMTPDQENELHDMLMQIQEFESDTPKNATCYSQFFPVLYHAWIGQDMPMCLVFDAVRLPHVLPHVS